MVSRKTQIDRRTVDGPPHFSQGNKGAVAIRVSYQPNATSVSPSPLPITFTFVNSHLAAFDDHMEQRNLDFHDLSRRIKFGPYTGYVWAPRTKHREARPRKLNIFASDVLLWLVRYSDNQDYHTYLIFI
jgi:phosphatidylinositol-bisphosphatase